MGAMRVVLCAASVLYLLVLLGAAEVVVRQGSGNEHGDTTELSPCTLPVDSDECLGKNTWMSSGFPPKTRFYYNTATGGCRPFSYFGCSGKGGIANRFRTKEICEAACLSLSPSTTITFNNSSSTPVENTTTVGSFIGDEEDLDEFYYDFVLPMVAKAKSFRLVGASGTKPKAHIAAPHLMMVQLHSDDEDESMNCTVCKKAARAIRYIINGTKEMGEGMMLGVCQDSDNKKECSKFNEMLLTPAMAAVGELLDDEVLCKMVFRVCLKEDEIAKFALKNGQPSCEVCRDILRKGEPMLQLVTNGANMMADLICKQANAPAQQNAVVPKLPEVCGDNWRMMLLAASEALMRFGPNLRDDTCNAKVNCWAADSTSRCYKDVTTDWVNCDRVLCEAADGNGPLKNVKCADKQGEVKGKCTDVSGNERHCWKAWCSTELELNPFPCIEPTSTTEPPKCFIEHRLNIGNPPKKWVNCARVDCNVAALPGGVDATYECLDLHGPVKSSTCLTAAGQARVKTTCTKGVFCVTDPLNSRGHYCKTE